MRGVFDYKRYIEHEHMEHRTPDKEWAMDCDGCEVNEDGIMLGRDGIRYRSIPDWEIKPGEHAFTLYIRAHYLGSERGPDVVPGQMSLNLEGGDVN